MKVAPKILKIPKYRDHTVAKLNKVLSFLNKNKFITPKYIHHKPKNIKNENEKKVGIEFLILQVSSNRTYLQNNLRSLPVVLPSLFSKYNLGQKV